MSSRCLTWMKAGAASMLIAACVTGCGNTSAGEDKYKTQSYPQDGLMGLTSVNPNNPLTLRIIITLTIRN
ncbi:hypothetical protein [Paenibacillus hexagrammi]|uniref:Uncharacterized protein n=1 Tax=Paenibacillus hexagrammi TaxID=2908839 RepID=A0ABY3SHY9_9BACL|nr:hypothetical protein [Paenibacillus sp. YPD9-1]UJF33644.1 hypothetical protein L0M14_29920 [Paenibacillus sp. YPD9-1]